MRINTVKEKHIGSVLSEIHRYTQTDRDILLLLYIDYEQKHKFYNYFGSPCSSECLPLVEGPLNPALLITETSFITHTHTLTLTRTHTHLHTHIYTH